MPEVLTEPRVSALAALVKRERKRREWTQYQLAKAAGLSTLTISRVELAWRWPNLETRVKLMRALGLTRKQAAVEI